MDVTTAPAPAAFSPVDVLVLTVTEPPQPLTGPARRADRLLEGLISRAIDDGEITGKAGELILFHTPPAAGGQDSAPRRVAVVGVGDGADHLDWRAAGRAAAKAAGDLKAETVTLAAAPSDGPVEVGAFVDGFGTGAYRFVKFKSDAEERPSAKLTIAGGGATPSDLDHAALTVDAVNRARDLANSPANHMTPLDLADHASKLAADIDGLECEVLEEPALEALGAGALLSVARGSELPARLIVLRYEPQTVARESETLGIVGKAVTFDTGGISIKASSGMEEMKLDMAGGAAALEGAALIARLGLPVRLICAVPAAENMPSGTATKPGDVVTAMNGKTIEVINTDAEGRLILADALAWLTTQGASRLINFATLTGAIVVALGEVYAGLFGSDDEWLQDVRRAGEASGDLSWPMPLHEGYRPLIESRVADLANAAKKRQAGAVYAGMFLREFTGELPWCHVDIAGTGMVDGKGTGFGVRLLLALAQQLSLEK
ncbi:MAG: leucyl aminopeptidase [Thermoleophilia bacterium]|nr:leucyl aminopeptidase [Thermoleophilia bacterium]